MFQKDIVHHKAHIPHNLLLTFRELYSKTAFRRLEIIKGLALTKLS